MKTRLSPKRDPSDAVDQPRGGERSSHRFIRRADKSRLSDDLRDEASRDLEEKNGSIWCRSLREFSRTENRGRA